MIKPRQNEKATSPVPVTPCWRYFDRSAETPLSHSKTLVWLSLSLPLLLIYNALLWCIISNKTIISQAPEFSFNKLNKTQDKKFLPLYIYKWIDEKNLPLHCACTELKFILDRARVRGEYKLHTEIVTIPDFNFPFNINHPLILFIFSFIYIHSYIIYF